jgi:hypothetical protein
MHQLGLQFSPPRCSSRELDELLDLLADAKRCPDWMTALQIGVALGWSDRKVRKLASESDKVISYPGSPGYKILGRCTADEYHHYRNAMRAQARGMISRVMRTDRQFFSHPVAGI